MTVLALYYSSLSDSYAHKNRGDGEIDTFFEKLFVEWEKRNKFANKMCDYGKKCEETQHYKFHA